MLKIENELLKSINKGNANFGLKQKIKKYLMPNKSEKKKSKLLRFFTEHFQEMLTHFFPSLGKVVSFFFAT